MIKYDFKVAKDYLNYIDSIFENTHDFSNTNIEQLFLTFKDFDPTFKSNLIHSFLIRLPEEKLVENYHMIFSLLDKYNFVMDKVFAAALTNEKASLVNNEGIFKEISQRKLPHYERFYLMNCQNITIISTIVKSCSDIELLSITAFINNNTMRITEKKISELLNAERSFREKKILLKNYKNTKSVSRCLSRI